MPPAPPEPFFLDGVPGRRFCIYHPPSAVCRGAVLYAHPFAEEMNRSRRMSALQSAALSAAGFAVLRMDLFGCGDSDGDFGEARWEIWKEDLRLAKQWLHQRHDAPLMLWGLRAGALLALDAAREWAPDEAAAAVLWQPVIKGDLFLTQFLRLKLAGDMLAGEGETGKSGTLEMRDAFARGETLEIAGYALAAPLANALAGLDASGWEGLPRTIDWFEIVSATDKPVSHAAEKTARLWREKGSEVSLHQVACPPFWTGQEVVECPELVRATLESVERKLQ